MMQVAGGMDRLPVALAARLGNRITYRAAVREIRQSERGVWVIYADGQGQQRRLDADYCISTIPLPVLTDIDKDVSQPVQAAIAAARYDGAGKIGLQFKRRFWEQDDEIYGGRSWTDQEVGQIIYPSHGWTTAKGVLVGYYLDFRGTMRERPPAAIQRLALEHGARVHPQYRPNSSMRSPSPGHGCRGVEAHGGRNRPRHIRGSHRYASLTGASISPATT